MGELADLLSKGSPDEPSDSGDGGGDGDEKKMAEDSVKAMFAAAKAGDFTEATAQFASAMKHCQTWMDADDGGGGGYGGDAEDTGKSKPGMVIAIGHKR